VWFIAIAAVLLLIVVAVEQTGKQAATAYSTFLNQVEAGNVASVTFQGTEILGRFKRPLDSALGDTFRSRVPDFGDPTLIPELRKQHVVIEVTSPSAWSWLLGRVPWPMLLFVAAMLVADFIKLLRGGAPQSASTAPVRSMPGMMGLLANLFAKQQDVASPPASNGREPKERNIP